MVKSAFFSLWLADGRMSKFDDMNRGREETILDPMSLERNNGLTVSDNYPIVVKQLR